MKHLLKLLDLSREEIIELLDLADKLKADNKAGIPHPLLKGKTLGMIFSKSSTRTRVSFETGMYQLGGQALFLSSRDLQIGRGEPVQDTARTDEEDNRQKAEHDGSGKRKVFLRFWHNDRGELVTVVGSRPAAEFIHADIQRIRQCHQLDIVRHGFAGLPLADCLTGYANLLSKGLLT